LIASFIFLAENCRGGPDSLNFINKGKYLQEREGMYKGVAHGIATSYLASY
jgi:hypothetical protein